MSAAIEKVWKDGGKLDSWSEYFSYERWVKAFRDTGVDMDFFTVRERNETEIFPWDISDVGVRKDFLWHEYEMAIEGKLSPDCRVKCTGCGANKLLDGGVCDA